MVKILEGLLNQDCVYWAPTDRPINKFGELGYEEPVALKCKWQEQTRKIRGSDGAMITVSHTIHLSSEIKVGGILWRGLLVNKPDDPPLELKIVSTSRTDSVSNDESLWVANV